MMQFIIILSYQLQTNFGGNLTSQYYFLFASQMDWSMSDEENYSQSSEEQSQTYPHSQGQDEDQKQTEIQQNDADTPQQILELTEADITCQICSKYALNAVICQTQTCKKLFCLDCVNRRKKILQDKCPFCQSKPFKCYLSPYSQVINKLELQCTFCKIKYNLQNKQAHYRYQCPYFHLLQQCRYCDQRIKKEKIVSHTKQTHPQKIQEMIMDFYTKIPVQPKASGILKANKSYLQKIEKRPQLGSTGKFYCGGKLEPNCHCCNGFCGPTNGENCNECMRLDLLRFRVPKGHLVNSRGDVCWKQGEQYTCGVLMPNKKLRCAGESPCESCKKMTTNIMRYRDLI